MATLIFIAVLVVNGVVLTEAAHVKIHIVPDHREIRRFARDVSSTACGDKVMVDGSELPQGMFPDRTTFYRSEYVTRRLTCLIESSTVAGISTPTYVSSVVQEYEDAGCTSFPHGGVVRDQFLGGTPNDIDFKIDCEISKVYDICIRNWTAAYCQNATNANNQTFVHIGQPKSEALDYGESADEFSGNLRLLEYTVNSIVYWPNRSLVVDIAGNGVEDVCARRIRIPSDTDRAESWELWIDRGNNDRKVYRYWKLRVRNFTPLNDATRDFIVNEAQDAIRRNVTDFKSFYCRTVYSGSEYLISSDICHVNDSMLCINGLTLSAKYDLRLREDMTDDYINNLQIPICNAANAAAASIPFALIMLLLAFLFS